MERQSVIGRAQYSKTSCYLCSEWLDDNDVEKHLRHCRQQQIVCPNRCGVIVAHEELQLHTNTCRASYGEAERLEPFGSGIGGNPSPDQKSEHHSVDQLSSEDMLTSLENSLSWLMQERRGDQLNARSNLHDLMLAQGHKIDQDGEFFRKELCEVKTRLTPLEQHAPTNEQRIKDLETRVERYRRETYYTKQRLDDLQQMIKMADYRYSLASEHGHVIWRIDQVEERMDYCKKHGTMLRGPMFTDKPHGYLLQLEANLYGLEPKCNQNLVVGLTVLRAPYDNLLKWPCPIIATLVLRDQPTGRSVVENFSTPITAMRKVHPERNRFYVNIPHQILFTKNFIYTDTMFLELIIGDDQSSH